MKTKKKKLLDQIEVLKKEVESIDGKKRWIPEEDDRYYYVDSDQSIEECDYGDVRDYDEFRLMTRNCFKTQDEAKNHLKLIEAKAELQDHMDEFEMPEDDDDFRWLSSSGVMSTGRTFDKGNWSMMVDYYSGQILPKSASDSDCEERLRLLKQIVELTNTKQYE